MDHRDVQGCVSASCPVSEEDVCWTTIIAVCPSVCLGFLLSERTSGVSPVVFKSILYVVKIHCISFSKKLSLMIYLWTSFVTGQVEEHSLSIFIQVELGGK